MTGTLPDYLGSFPALSEFRAENNQLTGSIPAGLGGLPQLRYVTLQNNRLEGCIPPSLTPLCAGYVNIDNNPGLPAWTDFCANGANGQVSVRNGNWQDAGTWACGRVPTVRDFVTLKHTVTVPAGTGQQARQIRYTATGSLQYETGGTVQIGQ